MPGVSRSRSEGRYEAAAIAFQQAVTASPSDGVLRGNLGDALSLMNRKTEARQAWLESVRLDRQALVVNPNDATTFARSTATRKRRCRFSNGR